MLNSAQSSFPPSHIMLETNRTNRSTTNMKIFTLQQQNSQKSAGGAFLHIMTRPLLAPSRSCFFCFLPTACWFLLDSLMRNGIKLK